MKEVIIKSRDGSSCKMGAKGLLECLVGKKNLKNVGLNLKLFGLLGNLEVG